MRIIIETVIAGLLTAAATAIVLFWLSAVPLAYGWHGGLEPWIASGIILMGFAFIFLAAVPGLPGILWAKSISSGPASTSARVSKFIWKAGSAVLLAGTLAAGIVLLVAKFSASPDGSAQQAAQRDVPASGRHAR